ncbi:MAG: DsrE family protein [Pirellulales bacterium]|nr:DsrE family protein [Pirellulales bacterium]
MRTWIWLTTGLLTALVGGIGGEEARFHFPQVAAYGLVAEVPGAAEPPRRGAKIVFDVVSDGKPEELNKGLESVARYLNLNATSGFEPTDVKLAVVLHGPATRAALNDTAYTRATGAAKNPNLALVWALKECGVEVFVCGQSLARNRFARSEVASDVVVAVSAMTVNVNKQQDRYAYLAIH